MLAFAESFFVDHHAAGLVRTASAGGTLSRRAVRCGWLAQSLADADLCPVHFVFRQRTGSRRTHTRGPSGAEEVVISLTIHDPAAAPELPGRSCWTQVPSERGPRVLRTELGLCGKLPRIDP